MYRRALDAISRSHREDASLILRSGGKYYPWLEFDDRFGVFKRSTKLEDIYATIKTRREKGGLRQLLIVCP